MRRPGPDDVIDEEAVVAERVNRPLPQLTPENEFFWTAGADGELRFQHCTACGAYLHPPGPICPYCRAARSR